MIRLHLWENKHHEEQLTTQEFPYYLQDLSVQKFADVHAYIRTGHKCFGINVVI